MPELTETQASILPTLPEVGASASRAYTFTQAEVAQYADLVGDHNPVHLDAEFAARTPFGRPIAHGLLVASLLSGLLGEELPGPGSIYLGQSLRFEAPVHIGDRVIASVEVTAVRAEKRIITLHTECATADGVRVISGEAIIKL
jgi:acyl dehydratase